MQHFVSWSLSVYTLNQVACFTQSLFTNCSRQNGESWQWRHYHTNWGLSICSFDQITSLIFPLSSHVLFTMCWPFVDDVVTSWPQTKISDCSKIKCIVILVVQNRTCSIPKCVSCTSNSCMIQSNSTVYTVIFGLWYKYHDTCFTCNRGLTRRQ